MPQPIEVKLVSHTNNPVGMIYATEKYAKHNANSPVLIDPEVVEHIRNTYKANPDPAGLHYIRPDDAAAIRKAGFSSVKEYVDDIDQWVSKVMGMAIPIADSLQFSFQISGISIAFREQLVRHKIGSSQWIQGGRITNYSTFATEDRYNIPDAIKNSTATVGVEAWNPEEGTFKKEEMPLLEAYKQYMLYAENFYNKMMEADIPFEDAREVVPSGVQHRLTWNLNLRSLIEILKHRTCWIVQDHWVPLVQGMVDELKKVDPVFAIIGQPPCIKNGKFNTCVFDAIAEERYTGADPLPICPLWKSEKKKAGTLPEHKGGWENKERQKKYAAFWSNKELS